MKKVLLILIFILLGDSEVLGQNMAVQLFYFDYGHNKIFLKNTTPYDLENKPKILFIKKNSVGEKIYIIDVYRKISSERHYYRSYIVSQSNLAEGINIAGAFEDNTTPFITVNAVVISICETDKENYLKLKNIDDCFFIQEYTIEFSN
jgi:hypothetical protein